MSTETEVNPLLGGLLRSLADYWWLLLLRGLAAIAFGVVAFVWPGLTLVALTLLWGAYALADGILALWAALAPTGGNTGRRWWLALGGVVSILAGLCGILLYGNDGTRLADVHRCLGDRHRSALDLGRN